MVSQTDQQCFGYQKVANFCSKPRTHFDGICVWFNQHQIHYHLTHWQGNFQMCSSPLFCCHWCTCYFGLQINWFVSMNFILLLCCLTVVVEDVYCLLDWPRILVGSHLHDLGVFKTMILFTFCMHWGVNQISSFFVCTIVHNF